MKILFQYAILALFTVGAFTNCAKNEFGFGKVSALSCDPVKDSSCINAPGVPAPTPQASATPTPTPHGDDSNPVDRKLCDVAFAFGLQNKIENGEPICDLMEIRYCFDGYLNGTSGDYTATSCKTKNPTTANSSRTCTLDGRVIKHGQNSIFYRKKVISKTQNCIGEIRVCDNGFLTGSDEFSSASCGSSEYKTPDGIFKNCSFNGSVIAEGATTVAYKTEKSIQQPDGTWACNFTVRRCIDGVLDNAGFEFSGCNPTH